MIQRKAVLFRLYPTSEEAAEMAQIAGARPKLTPQQTAHARKLIAEGQHREDVAALFKVDRSTLYRALADSRA
jgi:DNA invertase Pin-like site-specific DNA recombinase